jgi:lysophospholipase L1-like esterase
MNKRQFLSFLALGLSTLHAETKPTFTHPSQKWEKAIFAFEESDKKSPPPTNAILFIGASGIARWKSLTEDFADKTVINRGFGGSQLEDAVYYADRIVIPYKPKMIVLQSGGNDINAGKSPEQVAKDFEAFVAKVRAALPDVRIAYLGQSPSTSRWAQAEKQKQMNKLITDIIAKGQNMVFIDIWKEFLGSDGKPNDALFVEDKLHHNAEGYKIRTRIVKPFLEGK